MMPTWNITHTYEQPYLPMSYNPFTTSTREHATQLELERLAQVDQQVDAAQEYPLAQLLLEKFTCD